MEFPQELQRELEDILQGEYPLFQAAMGQKPHGGLRFNAAKANKQTWQKLPLSGERVPWTDWGFYTSSPELARHPYHHGGIFYLQEPSAMAPAEILRPQKGHWVLDLCAAPGGKATRLGEFLAGTGFLLANDVSNSRCRGLLRNMERFGTANVAVSNETPQRLRQHFGPAFHRVLVDAPCSGQGMFRKDPKLLKDYLARPDRPYSQWQREILAAAAELTAPGGELVYSTCTFSVAENEAIISDFLSQHSDFYPVTIPLTNGFAPGVDNQPGTVRLWPHRLQGEGHFIAHLAKKGVAPVYTGLKEEDSQQAVAAFENFLTANGVNYPQGLVQRHKNALYLTAPTVPDCQGLKLAGRGLYLGDIRNDRFIPSQPWALSLRASQVQDPINWRSEDKEATDYLKGLTVKADAPKGYRLITVDGFSLGWVKSDGCGTLKNLYPPQWRNI